MRSMSVESPAKHMLADLEGDQTALCATWQHGGLGECGLKAFRRPSGGTEKQMFKEVQGKEGGEKKPV